MHIVMKLLE